MILVSTAAEVMEGSNPTMNGVILLNLATILAAVFHAGMLRQTVSQLSKEVDEIKGKNQEVNVAELNTKMDEMKAQIARMSNQFDELQKSIFVQSLKSAREYQREHRP